jgi:hypothetical protein
MPCIECVNCDRLFFLAQTEIDAEKNYWCKACFLDMLDRTVTAQDMEDRQIDLAFDTDVDA